ncbi:MAG: TIGR02206 family membrane protein [Candidatus Marinimicrobia bacterium]|nr:TIGR02206 family membrane protein [Candidatus Neomarinimicrobiota bacterium]
MKDKIAQYMYDETVPFVFMGLDHLISIIIFIILSVTIPYFAKKHLNENQQHFLGSIIGGLIALAYLSWLVLEIVGGTYSSKLHLPFHLCRTANLLIFIVLVFRSYLAYEIVFFWGLTVIHAVITPDILQGFPHFHFIRYWLSHQLMIIGILYATFVYDIRPRKKSIYVSFISLILFLLITIPVNLFLDSNYFWICGKPPVGTVLDFFGPWPWYIIVSTFLALLHFYFFYYIISFVSKKLS